MTKKFYRVETPSQHGPYHAPFYVPLGGRPYGYQPAPQDDELLGSIWDDLKDPKAYIFGFATKAQLTRWFGEDDRKALKETGFTLATYETTAIVYGATQVIARRDRIRLIERTDLP